MEIQNLRTSIPKLNHDSNFPFFDRGRKGISPLIAAVLLIAFTMAVATIAGPWMTQLLQNTQEGVSDQAVDVTRASNLGLEIMSVEFNRSSNELEVVVQNTGEPINNKTNVSIGVIGGSVAKTQQYDVDLSAREITTLNLPVDRTYPLDTVQASLTTYPVSTESGIKCTPTKGLVGYWTFNEEQTQNGWAVDLSGYGNNGSIENSVDSGEIGKVGGSYEFSGGNLRVSDSNSLDMDKVTALAWAKSDGTGHPYGNILNRGNSPYWANQEHSFAFREITDGINRWNWGIITEDVKHPRINGNGLYYRQNEWQFVGLRFN
ncbi:MAG: hypothetical protein H8Z69_03105, partial [Nanohaloarchaea archaeon]|nr:hypothetical protein [Candidatus Nanohaloarchaea archaeon]